MVGGINYDAPDDGSSGGAWGGGIHDTGDGDGGGLCGCATGGAGAPWPALLLALALVRRRHDRL